MKTASTDLHCPVASHKLVIKVDTNLRYSVVTSEYQSTDDIVPTITACLKTGNLRSSDHHRLAQVLEHEAESRGGVAEGVSAMQDNKSIIPVVHLTNVPGRALLFSCNLQLGSQTTWDFHRPFSIF